MRVRAVRNENGEGCWLFGGGGGSMRYLNLNGDLSFRIFLGLVDAMND